MLDKWRTMDGVGRQYTLGDKMKRMTGNEGRTALRLSAGVMERYGLHDSTAGMTGQLGFGDVPGSMVKDEPDFQGQMPV
jgi:hypothetical protein